ncbi:MAG: class I SAM-dependent methyltransferase [Planctomycetota bacterium]
MDEHSKKLLSDNYRNLLLKHGAGPAVGQWSQAGQIFRFEKLIQIDNLASKRILDLGCGIGDLYPFLQERFCEIDYSGIDLVPELIACASHKYPRAKFFCRDILQAGLDEQYDYVLISGMFNNPIPNCTAFLKEMIALAFKHCRKGLAFNFTSTHVNYSVPNHAYHDPAEVLAFCIANLTRKVFFYHHYERCDVAVFAYKQELGN